MPVKTISFSRGSSRSMLRRLCSRAPRMVIVSATVRPCYRLTPVIERTFGPRPGDRHRRGATTTATCGAPSADGAQLPLQLADLVAQARGLLEAEVAGRVRHLVLQFLDQA